MMLPCISKRSPIAAHPRPFCCARATARRARACPGAGRGQEAHPAEPLRLAARADRRLQGAAQRRHRHSQGPGCHHHYPLAAAWSCRRGARHRAQDRPRSAARPQACPGGGRGQSLPLMNSNTLHVDDTPVPVLAPRAGKTKTGRLWTYPPRPSKAENDTHHAD
jgi:Transposase IS66 family